MEEIDAIELIKPKMNHVAPRSSTTYRGKIGEINNVIQNVNDMKINRYRTPLDSAALITRRFLLSPQLRW
jgi:hypothetical protein